MPIDVQGYSTSVVTTTGDNTKNIFTQVIPTNQKRTYTILTIGNTADFKFTRQYVTFTVYNDSGTLNFVDSPVVDIIPPFESMGFASSPSYAYSSTGDTLTLDVTGPSDEEEILWKCDITWSPY